MANESDCPELDFVVSQINDLFCYKWFFFQYAIVLGWTGAVGLGIAVVYGLGYPKIIHNLELPSEAVNVMYGSFHRLAWGVALAWMVWACVKGYGGSQNSLLKSD